MQWLKGSRACVAEAQDLYTIIENAMTKELTEIELDRVKVKIKNFFENCRSPLDYIANYIHETYCLGKKQNLYFPIRHTEKKFKEYMKTSYFGLEKSNINLYNLLESMQPYHLEYTWLRDLSTLVNHNKHQNLSRQKNQTNLYNASFKINGNTFINCSSVGSIKSPLSINGQAITNLDLVKTNPFIKSFSGEFEYIYYFSDFKLPVSATINTIINGVDSIIEDIASEINK